METKDFKFKLDDSDESEGTFSGLASVYDVIDSYNERVKRGAFRKTLIENDGKFPLFWIHDIREPLGIVYAKDTTKGLKVTGHLNLDVQSAIEKRSLAKQGAIKGLSIGFKTLRDEWDDNVRVLKEIQLHEISLTPLNIQACPGAELDSVKSDMPDEFKPYPNEHSARLKNPDKFDPDTFRRKSDGTIYGSKKIPSTVDVIWGKLKTANKPSDNPIPQALRFPVKNWTVAEAKKWLVDNGITYMRFEPASKSFEAIFERILSIETIGNLSQESLEIVNEAKAHLEALVENWEQPLAIGTVGQIDTPLDLSNYLDEFRKLNKSFGG